MEPNPYEAPLEPLPLSRQLQKQNGTRFVLILLPTVGGALIGSVLLPSLDNVYLGNDPIGHVVSAGLGGFAGLALGIFIRTINR
jgi:hypothetical protein